MEILRNKNLTTRFQILVEIAGLGPNVHQLDIASRLHISPQAVSDYIKQLNKEGLVTIQGRSKYGLTEEGTNWVIKVLRGMRDYTVFIEKAITNISVSAAVAGADLSKGQTVSLEMRNGVLMATDTPAEGARGRVLADAKKGEDVGVTDIEGVIPFARGKVIIASVPVIQEGGSNRVNYDLLKSQVKKYEHIGAIGIEAIVALRKLGVEPVYKYGVTEAAVEAARCGLDFLIVSSSDAITSIVPRLSEEHLAHELLDTAIPANHL